LIPDRRRVVGHELVFPLAVPDIKPWHCETELLSPSSGLGTVRGPSRLGDLPHILLQLEPALSAGRLEVSNLVSGCRGP
jgi:hypothetical protein